MKWRWAKFLAAAVMASVALFVSGTQAVHASYKTAVPGFAELGQSWPFYETPQSGSNWTYPNATPASNSYGARAYEFFDGQGQVWSNNADVDIDQDWTMSYWVSVPHDVGSQSNDGMAFVLQPTSNMEIANKGIRDVAPQTMGVYGFEGTLDTVSQKELASRAIQNSVAVEFDPYVDNIANQTDGYDLDGGASQRGQHIAVTYPGAQDTYKLSKANGLVTPIALSPVFSYYWDNSGDWTHVTIVNDASTGRMNVLWDDRDPATNAPKEVYNNHAFKIDKSKLGGKSKFFFGFTDFNKNGGIDEGKNRVVLDTYSKYITTTATSALTDTAKGKSQAIGPNADKGERNFVYGTDPLTYTMTLTNTSGSTKSLSGAYLKAALPEHVTWNKITTDKGTELSTTALNSSTGAVLPTLDQGKSVTITASGVAENVKTNTDVPAQDYQFRNGGAENYLLDDELYDNPDNYYTTQIKDKYKSIEHQHHSPAFTIKPAYLATATTKVKDLTVISADGTHPAAKDTTVFGGDKLEYTFNLKYDPASPLDWTDISAKLFTADQQQRLDLDHATATVKIGKDATPQKLTADQLKNGYLINGSMYAHGDVTFNVQVSSKVVQSKTDLDDGSQYTNDAHTAKPDSPYNVTLNPLKQSANTVLQVNPDSSLVDYSGWKTATLTGNVTDKGTLSTLLGLNVSVNGGEMQRLAMTPQAKAPYVVHIPTGDADAVDDGGLSDKQLLSTKLDGTKINTVTLQAIDGAGNLSEQVSIKVGKFVLSADPEIRFNDEAQLDGKDWDLASKSFKLNVTNTLFPGWTLTAQASAMKDDSGKELSGKLVYRDGSQSHDLKQDVLIDTSTTAGTTSVTDKWTHENVATDSNSGKGLFVQVDGNAMPGDYHGTVTWTLTKAPN